MARIPLLQMSGISLTFGGDPVFDNLDLVVQPSDSVALVGRNGSGKSTLMKVMAGLVEADRGSIVVPPGTSVGYMEQEPEMKGFSTLGDFASSGLDAGEMYKVERAGEGLKFDPARSVETASGGERRRAALAKLMAEAPELMLLDEPTNHLDAESVAWLQRHLADYTGAVVMVTHDRYFLDNVTGWILEVDRGRGIPYEGNYSAYLEAKAKRMRQEEREENTRQKTLAREMEWMGKSPSARRAKSKARINAYEDLLAASEKSDMRDAQIVIPTPPRLGDLVIEADHINKGFGDRLLIDDLSFKLPPGGIVGVIGPNGAGKSTLFKMITGSEKPDEGTFKVGDTVKLGYVDQSRDALNADNNVWEEISGGTDIIKLGKVEMQSRAYVSAFNFRGPDQQKKVGDLSGGQRNRVHLAKMLRTEANVILLDEPTNDLDTETLAALEEALENYAGCAVVISHDRWFLDRLATHILAFEGDSQVVWFEGNYEDYEADFRKRMGHDADTPRKLKYRPLRKAG